MLLLAKCLVIWEFIATTEAVENARSVHVALETALTFNKKDSSANVKFIDDFQDFLSHIRNTVVKSYNKDKPNRRNFRENEPKREARVASYVANLKFTEFIKELINILKNYKDDDLEDVIAIIDDEIRKYHYKGCKFYELLSNNNLRRLVANKLDLVKDIPVEALRNNLDQTLKILQSAKSDSRKSELLDYIDSLYTRNDVKKLQKTLGYFHIYQNKYKRSNMDLKSLVRESIRSVIFDHYSNLNPNTRRDFKVKLETFFWQNVIQKDNVQHLKWTINDTKKVQNLIEHTNKHTASKETESSNEIVNNEKEDPDSAPPNQNKNSPSKTVNLNMQIENQIDFVKLGRVSYNIKKDVKPKVESEDASVDEKNDKQKVVREGRELDEKNTEQIESEEERESATVSDEHNVSVEGHDVESAVNKYNDDASKDADNFSDEVDLPTKGRQYYNLKYSTPLLSTYMNEFSAETERDKKQKVKGFTRSSIKSDNKKNYENNADTDTNAKPKEKKYKMETTLDTRYRVHTIWEEAYITDKQQENTSEEANESQNDSDVLKTTKMTDVLRSRIEEKENLNLKTKKNKHKHIPKAVNVIDSGKIIRIGFGKNDKTQKAIKKDFSLKANLENVSPEEGEGLKFKLAASKKTDDNKKVLRMEINKDEKPEKTKYDVNSNEKVEKEHIERGKSSDELIEEENSHEFTKRHKNKKPISKSKHQTIETTKEETRVKSEEEINTTTKSPQKIKKPTTTQSPITPEKQSDEKSTENENSYSKEEEITTSKRTKRPKKTKTLTEQTTSPKSVEKSIEEEEPHSTTNKTKKEKKRHKKAKSSTPKQTKTTEKSTEEVNESTEKRKHKKKHQRREKSSKRHIHKKKDKKIEKSSDEEHSESKEEETPNENLLRNENKNEDHSESKKKEMPIQNLINNEKRKKERKKDRIKSLPKHTKRETVKPTTDIFISVESNDHHLIKRFKTVSNQMLSTNHKELSKEFTTTPTKEAKYKAQEESNENDKSTNSSKSDEDDSQDIQFKIAKPAATHLDYSIEFKISKPTPTHLVVKTTDALTSTANTHATGKNYEKIELPTTVETTYNKYPSMRASKEKLANKTDANEESSSSEANIGTKITSKSYLQLIDILHNGQTMVVNLDSLKPYPKADNTKVNRTDFKYPLSDFWKRHNNKVKNKTVTNLATTRSMPTTQLTTKTVVTTTPLTTTESYTNKKKQRKKKKKRRRTTKTNKFTTTTEATTNQFTTIQNQPIRRNIDGPNKPNDTLENAKNIPDYEKALEDYYNANNTLEHENVTKQPIGEELQEFLDIHGIKLDDKNETDINLDAVNELLGPGPATGKPDIEAEIKNEKARIALDRDMLKLYGKTISHVEISTTPWNTLFTDPIDGLNQKIDSLNQNLLDLKFKK